MKAVGLESSFLEIELFSDIRSSLDQSLQPQIVLDMGASSTKLYIVERGILRNSHVINRGSQDITIAVSKSMGLSFEEAERMKRTYGIASGASEKDLTDITPLTLEYIFSESSRVLLSYQKKYNKNVSKVVLTGGGVNLKGIVDYAKKCYRQNVLSLTLLTSWNFPHS